MLMYFMGHSFSELITHKTSKTLNMRDATRRYSEKNGVSNISLIFFIILYFVCNLLPERINVEFMIN